jgi:quinol monooxygenase YgiN
MKQGNRFVLEERTMTEHQTPQAAAAFFSPVVELRRYTLHPGKRDALVDVFDRHLVETQEDAGMKVIGQFRDLDHPDHFVWLRGFEDMEARRRSLEAFYNGPVWAAHRDAANATMIDSDDVLLLRPACPDAGFDLAGAARGPRDALTEAPSPDRSALLAVVHHVAPDCEPEFLSLFENQAAPLLASLDAPLIAAFVTEHAENTFPRLPVRAAENVFVAFARFAGRAALAAHQVGLSASPEWQELSKGLAGCLSKPTEAYRLVPTARSLLA